MADETTEISDQEKEADQAQETPQIIINTGESGKKTRKKRAAPPSVGVMDGQDKKIQAELAKYKTDFYSWQEAFVDILDKFPDVDYTHYKVLVQPKKKGRIARGDNYTFYEFFEMCNESGYAAGRIIGRYKEVRRIQYIY